MSDLKEAQAFILAGNVLLKSQPAKAGSIVSDPADITLKPGRRFASRGGEKLEGALKCFGISPKGKVCADVGASTGGFTDCLLRQGAAKVWAIDVGVGLLDQRLASDPRVVQLERENFRSMDLAKITDPIELVTADLSFISLDKIFPKIGELLAVGADAIVLVKPQFEGSPKEVPEGIVKDEPTRQVILERAKASAVANGFTILGVADSELSGRKGNREAFFHLTKKP